MRHLAELSSILGVTPSLSQKDFESNKEAKQEFVAESQRFKHCQTHPYGNHFCTNLFYIDKAVFHSLLKLSFTNWLQKNTSSNFVEHNHIRYFLQFSVFFRFTMKDNRRVKKFLIRSTRQKCSAKRDYLIKVI